MAHIEKVPQRPGFSWRYRRIDEPKRSMTSIFMMMCTSWSFIDTFLELCTLVITSWK